MKRAALIHLPLDVELAKALNAYRANRRIERGGKVIGNSVAIREILKNALEGVQPPTSCDLPEIQRKVNVLWRKYQQSIEDG